MTVRQKQIDAIRAEVEKLQALAGKIEQMVLEATDGDLDFVNENTQTPENRDEFTKAYKAIAEFDDIHDFLTSIGGFDFKTRLDKASN